MTSKLSKKTLLLWRLRCVIVFTIIIAVLLFFSFLSPLLLIPAAITAIFGIFIIFVFLPLYFKSYSITVDNNAVIVKRGIIIKAIHILPFPRLVFARGFSTPLASRLGLMGVTLKAARGILIIPEMNSYDAEKLIEGLSGGYDNEA